MKFALNKNTKTLHIIGGCRFTKHSLVGYELFSTEDGAVRAWGRYMKNCKLCFKDRDRE